MLEFLVTETQHTMVNKCTHNMQDHRWWQARWIMPPPVEMASINTVAEDFTIFQQTSHHDQVLVGIDKEEMWWTVDPQLPPQPDGNMCDGYLPLPPTGAVKLGFRQPPTRSTSWVYEATVNSFIGTSTHQMLKCMQRTGRKHEHMYLIASNNQSSQYYMCVWLLAQSDSRSYTTWHYIFEP